MRKVIEIDMEINKTGIYLSRLYFCEDHQKRYEQDSVAQSYVRLDFIWTDYVESIINWNFCS